MFTVATGASAKPVFEDLLFNTRWYRTYDTGSSIAPQQGRFLFAWNFGDSEKKPDSFFVGIDTLWALPQDVDGDTAADWDLQVCPDEICMNGLKAGIHGADAPYPFGDTTFRTEHHFQFFPAISKKFEIAGVPGALFGALMYCKSRTTGVSDTVLAFGAWELDWDSTSPPPVRPVNGYLPKRSDFAVSGNTVRYLKSGNAIRFRNHRSPEARLFSIHRHSGGLRFDFADLRGEKELTLFASDGRKIAGSGLVSADYWTWDGASLSGAFSQRGFLFARLTWKEKAASVKLPWIP